MWWLYHARWNISASQIIIREYSRPGILTELFALKICINFSRSCNPKLHIYLVVDRISKIGFLSTGISKKNFFWTILKVSRVQLAPSKPISPKQNPGFNQGFGSLIHH